MVARPVTLQRQLHERRARPAAGNRLFLRRLEAPIALWNDLMQTMASGYAQMLFVQKQDDSLTIMESYIFISIYP